MKNILLIIDDFNLANNISKGSKLSNFHLIIASGYDEGIKLINDQYPDLIITDLDIKQGKNYYNLRTIRELTFYHHIPIILLYNHINQELCLRIWELGVSLFFNKMMNSDQLIKIINQEMVKN
jgi:DNA-binding response OmpR family regulator